MDPRHWQNHHRIQASIVPTPAVPFDAAAANRSIEEQFANIVGKRRDAVAVVDEDVTWTYGEFDALTNRVAHTLLARLGPGPEPVVVIGQHRAAIIAAMFGILKAGKFIVSVDPHYPPTRIATILADLSARLVLADANEVTLAAAVGEAAPDAVRDDVMTDNAADVVARADAEWVDIDVVLASDVSTRTLEIRNQPDDYAYIMFTSGSTGTPKGVIETHRNVLNFVRQRLELSCEGTNERAASVYPHYFSGAASTVYPVLLSGSLLAPFDVAEKGFARLKEWIRDANLNWVEGTPAMWRALLETVEPGETFPHVTRAHAGGDRFSGELMRTFLRTFPNAMLRTGYGASEKKYITYYLNDAVMEVIPSALPAGFPVDDLEIVIVNELGQPLPVGESGEVIIYSDYLSPGYWRRPEVTAAKFGRDEKGAFYRTGDLGKLDEAGCLWLLGRLDGQLKIHGQRVEIAEVEHTFISLPEVEQVVVTPHTSPQGDVELAAYVTLSAGAPLNENDLRRMLRARVAPAMVPRYVTILPSLPLTNNGKPDRKQLPPPQEPTTARYVAPQTPTQQRLAQMVGELLAVEQVGMADNFFDIGGTSLLGARLTLAIQRTFGVEISPRVLVEAPTLAGLAEAIETDTLREPGTGSDRLVVTVAEGTPERLPFYLFLGGGGSLTELMWYAGLLRRLDRAQPVYAFLAQGIDGNDAPFGTVDEMVTTYIDEIRRRQPDGPYLLGGECIGGKLAYAVAQALCAAGDEVALLALLDVALPTHQGHKRLRDAVRQWQRRLLYHWDHVRRLGAVDSAHYVWQRLAHGLRLPRFQTAAMRRHLAARQRYRKILTDYAVATPVDVPAALLLSQESAHQGVPAAWQDLLAQVPSISVVPGDHRSYLADHVDKTARHLDQYLATAQPAQVDAVGEMAASSVLSPVSA